MGSSRHTSVLGHALGRGNSDSKGTAGRRFRINGSKCRQVRREKAAFRNPAGSEQINAEAFKSFDAPMHVLELGVIRNARGENQRYFWDKYAARQRGSDNGSGSLGLGNGSDN